MNLYSLKIYDKVNSELHLWNNYIVTFEIKILQNLIEKVLLHHI